MKPKSRKHRRYGMMLRVKPERFEEYRRYHEAVWPGVLERITSSKISNYSIFHREGWLFAYFEYWGDDFDADMRLMGDDPETLRWWDVMKPMQEPLPTCAPGQWWAPMDEVFHID